MKIKKVNCKTHRPHKDNYIIVEVPRNTLINAIIIYSNDRKRSANHQTPITRIISHESTKINL